MSEPGLPFADVAVPAAYCLPVPPAVVRPIAGLVFHDSETATPARCHPDGSWHWQILRDGTLERHVDEAAIAFGVRAADRWRPDWVQRSPYLVSDVNWCTLHVEFQSCQADRDAGLPYTDAQYATAQALVPDLYARHGVVPIVGHGELQTDRTDPVAFDWERAGCGPFVAGEGRYWQGDGDDMSQVAALQAELDQAHGITATLQQQLDAVRAMLAQADSTIGALTHDVVPPLEAELESLKAGSDPTKLAALQTHIADLEDTIKAAQQVLAAAGPAPAG